MQPAVEEDPQAPHHRYIVTGAFGTACRALVVRKIVVRDNGRRDPISIVYLYKLAPSQPFRLLYYMNGFLHDALEVPGSVPATGLCVLLREPKNWPAVVGAVNTYIDKSWA